MKSYDGTFDLYEIVIGIAGTELNTDSGNYIAKPERVYVEIERGDLIDNISIDDLVNAYVQVNPEYRNPTS